MTAIQTYDDVIFTKGPLGLETPKYVKYVEDGQGGSRPVEVSPSFGGYSHRMEEPTGKYAGNSKAYLDDFVFNSNLPELASGGLAGAALGAPDWRQILDRGTKESWTDIPGAGRRPRGTVDLLNRSQFQMIPPNPLRQLPHPALRNLIDEGIVPYFKQHGPRPYGSGAI